MLYTSNIYFKSTNLTGGYLKYNRKNIDNTIVLTILYSLQTAFICVSNFCIK